MTGESAQLYRRQGDARICVAAAERASGLRDTVPVGAVLPMSAGSAAQILLAWAEPERMHRGLRGAKFTATALAQVRRRGWAASVAEREPGVASVSAPVRGQGGKVIAAASVSGPIERLTRSPGRLHAVRWSRPATRSAPPSAAAPDSPAGHPHAGWQRSAGLLGWSCMTWAHAGLRRPWTSQHHRAAILVLCHHVRTPPHEGTACATRPGAGQPVPATPVSLETMRSCP